MIMIMIMIMAQNKAGRAIDGTQQGSTGSTGAPCVSGQWQSVTHQARGPIGSVWDRWGRFRAIFGPLLALFEGWVGETTFSVSHV